MYPDEKVYAKFEKSEKDIDPRLDDLIFSLNR